MTTKPESPGQRRMKTIPIERVRECLIYDPETGIFTREGSPVGCIASRGYVLINIDGVRYPAHHLAWAYVHGVSPMSEMDHINGIRNDNRIANLRLCTSRQNRANTPTQNKHEYRGVYLFKTSWRARIRIPGGKRLDIGSFESAEEAGLAYEVLAERIHGEYAFHNRRAA